MMKALINKKIKNHEKRISELEEQLDRMLTITERILMLLIQKEGG